MRVSMTSGGTEAYAQGVIMAVIFDLGEVLASPPFLLPTLAARIGTSEELLEKHYWTDRDAYDAGASATQYWAPIFEAVGRPGARDQFEELAELDATTWAELRPSARQLLRDCRASGTTVVVLSNSPHAMQTAADRAPWRTDVDHLFISATMDLMKPDPEIYTTVADALGVSGSQIGFIDDKQKNIDGALSAGWQAHLWANDADTRSWLVELDVL